MRPSLSATLRVSALLRAFGMPKRRRLTRRGLVMCGVAVACTIVPKTAAAQKDPFVDALIGFHSMLAGTYGDEGKHVLVYLEAMGKSLAAWDQAIREEESALRSQLQNAPLSLALQARTALGSLYFERGRLEEALQEFEAASQLDPQRAAFPLFRALVLEAAGREAEAAETFRTAWTLDPADPIKAYLLVARPEGASPDEVQRALATLLEAQQGAAASDARNRLSPFIEVSIVSDGAADTPIFSPALYAAGFALIARGRYDDAIVKFREAVARDSLVVDPATGSNRIAQGIAELRQGRIAAALVHLEAAVASSPDSSEAHRILALASSLDGNHATSIDHLEAAVRLSPHDERSRVALGRAFAEAGKLPQAERALQDTIETLADSAEARWGLADVYERLDRKADAIRELEAAAGFTVLAGKAALFWRLADLRYVQQNLDGVVQALGQRVRLNPNSAKAHRELGQIHGKSGRQDDALAELVVAWLLDPDDPETLTALGQNHLQSGRYEAAIGALQRAVDLKPRSDQARFALGNALIRSGKAEEGRAQLAEFQRLRAQVLEEQRRTFEVDVLKLEAGRRTGEGRHDLAAELWKKIVDADPEVTSNYFSLAQALVRAGQVEAATVHLEKAATMKGGLEAYRQLAELYAKIGRAEESQRAGATYEKLRQQALRAPEPGR